MTRFYSRFLIRFCLGLLFAITVSACQTPYQDMGSMGGVEQTRVAEDLYMIRASVNAYTPAARVDDYLLLRAAELALKDGYPYFIILGEEDLSTTSNFVLPGQVQTTSNGTAIASNGMATGSVNSSSVVMPPTTVSSRFPQKRIFAKMLKSKEDLARIVFDAKLIEQSLSPRYITNNMDNVPNKPQSM